MPMCLSVALCIHLSVCVLTCISIFDILHIDDCRIATISIVRVFYPTYRKHCLPSVSYGWSMIIHYVCSTVLCCAFNASIRFGHLCKYIYNDPVTAYRYECSTLPQHLPMINSQHGPCDSMQWKSFCYINDKVSLIYYCMEKMNV